MTWRSTQPPMAAPSVSVDRNIFTNPSIIHNRKPYLQHPPTAYHKQSRHPSPRASPGLHILSPRQHSSVSSDGTASSTASTSKINRPLSSSPYYMSPHVEQGHMSPSKPAEISRRLPSATQRSMSDTGRTTRDDNSAIFRYIQEQGAQERKDDHAISVLTFLSVLDPVYSAFTAFYSIMIGVFFLLASPIHICNKSFSAGDGIVRVLAPFLRKHLQFIHANSVEDLHDFDFDPFRLVLVHATSPLLSIGVAISAWVAASFWLFALMMGNPDGTEREDDGRATVLNLRNWWEKFLLSSAKKR